MAGLGQSCCTADQKPRQHTPSLTHDATREPRRRRSAEMAVNAANPVGIAGKMAEMLGMCVALLQVQQASYRP
jgi:hypothetical protein